MSLAGRARIHGCTMTVKRKTRVRALNATSRASWSDALTGIRVTLRESTRNLEQKIFGKELAATYICRAPAGTDIRPDDGMVSTDGAHLGEKFKVLDAVRSEEGPRHVVVALELTEQESFAA